MVTLEIANNAIISWASSFGANDAIASKAAIGILILFALIPLFLSAISRQTTVFLGSLVLSVVALLLFVRPNWAIEVEFVGAYLASLLVAILGLQMRRRAESIERRLNDLTAALVELRVADQRRFLAELTVRRDAEGNQ